MSRLRQLIPCLAVGAALYDFERDEVQLLAVDSGGELPLEAGAAFPLEGLEGAIERGREGQIFEEQDIAALPDPPPALQMLQTVGIQSYVGIPLAAHDTLIGVLGLAAGSARAFEDDQIAIARDVAGQLAVAIEHARLYEEVQRYSVKLEGRVAERTAQLRERVAEVEELNRILSETLNDLQRANRQLDEKAERLRDANAELEAFAYSVSHDLRAPLRAISGFSEIIARRHRDSLDEEGRHYFDNIIEASEHMGELIDDLLRYSRLGRRAVRLRPVPLDDVLAQVMGDLEGRIAAVDAELVLPDDAPTIRSSRTLLTQIFTNLIDNALTYHRPGVPPRIVVDCKMKPGGVVLSVADNGIGIAPEFQQKIFRIFQRLHSQDEYPGTGIGLAMVKKAADLLNGRVWVESTEGEGSTFFVELPTDSEQ
jgi:signal transduction histidine kinase